MHSQLRGHQTLQRLVGKRRRLPLDNQSALAQSSSQSLTELSNGAPSLALPEDNIKLKEGSQHLGNDGESKENAPSGGQSATCPICGRMLPSADEVINAHIDACLIRKSATTSRPPRKTTQTTLAAAFTSFRSKLGPGSKSLPNSTSKGLTDQQIPKPSLCNRSVSMPAALPLTPWRDSSLDPAPSPRSSKRKKIDAGELQNIAKDKDCFVGERGLEADLKPLVLQGDVLGKGVMNPVSACLGGIANRVPVPGHMGSEYWEVQNAIQRPVEDPGVSARAAVADARGPVASPGGYSNEILRVQCATEKGREVLDANVETEDCPKELDTWAVAQWRFEGAHSHCSVGRLITLVREPDNPKDPCAIMVALRVHTPSDLDQEQTDSEALGLDFLGCKGGVCDNAQRSVDLLGPRKPGEGENGSAKPDSLATAKSGKRKKGTKEEATVEGTGRAGKSGQVASVPTRTSPRKRSRSSFASDKPVLDTSGKQKSDVAGKMNSDALNTKQSEEGSAAEAAVVCVQGPTIVGYLPAVIAEHLAPLMDRFGAEIDGEVTVRPQCAGASTGIRLRVPMCVTGGTSNGRSRFLFARRGAKDSGSGVDGCENLELERLGLEAGKEEGEQSEGDRESGGKVCRGATRMGETQDPNLADALETVPEYDPVTGRNRSDAAEDVPGTLHSREPPGTLTPVHTDASTEHEWVSNRMEISASWRSACHAAAKARTALVADPSLPKYQGNFFYIVRTVLAADGHLFSDEETRVLRGIESAGSEGQRLLVRLFQRKGPWFRLRSLSYADVSNLPGAVGDLLSRGYLLSSFQTLPPGNSKAPGSRLQGKEDPGVETGGMPRDALRGLQTGKGQSGEGPNKATRRRSLRLGGTRGGEENGAGTGSYVGFAAPETGFEPGFGAGQEGNLGGLVGVEGGERRELATQGLGSGLGAGRDRNRKEDKSTDLVAALGLGSGLETSQDSGLGQLRWDPQAPEIRDAADVRERLAVLNVGELRELLCALGLKTKLEANGGKRDELLTWAVAAACDAQQTTPWGQGCHVAVREKIDELAGECVRLPDALQHLLWRVQRLFFLNGEQDLSAFLLVDMGVCKYPEYRCSRTGPVFRTRTDLLAYEKALDVAQRMDEAVEAADTVAALRLLSAARRGLECAPSAGNAAQNERRGEPRQGTGKVEHTCPEPHRRIHDTKDVQVPQWMLAGNDKGNTGEPHTTCTIAHAAAEADRCEKAGLLQQCSGEPGSDIAVREQDVHASDKLGVNPKGFGPNQLLPQVTVSLDLVPLENRSANGSAQEAFKSGRELAFNPSTSPSTNPEKSQTAQPLFTARFAAGWVYSVVATVGVSILEKEKRYTEAVTVLRQLLGGNHSRGRRGQWWGRLSIDLDHLGRKEDSLAAAEAGVEDPWVRGGDLLALQRRVCRLAKPPRRWRKPSYYKSVDRLYSPTICPETRIGGRPLNCTVGAKSRFYGPDNGQCGVEQLALQYYASEEGGGWTGVHSEGGVWSTFFGLLMWEVLFADVEEVFRTPFQTAPLDLDTDAFFPARQAAILDRLQLIQTGDVAALLAARWATSAGTWCRGVNWERHTLEELQTIAGCVGREGLAAVCRLLAGDHAGWTGGMPDLLLWREQKVSLNEVPLTEEEFQSPREGAMDNDTTIGLKDVEGLGEGTGSEDSDEVRRGLRERVDFRVKREAKLVEVKGPRDRLSEQQRAWIGALQAAGIAVEVCKVVEEAEMLKGTGAGKRRKR